MLRDEWRIDSRQSERAGGDVHDACRRLWVGWFAVLLREPEAVCLFIRAV